MYTEVSLTFVSVHWLLLHTMGVVHGREALCLKCSAFQLYCGLACCIELHMFRLLESKLRFHFYNLWLLFVM
jgi:hypothetical protein